MAFTLRTYPSGYIDTNAYLLLDSDLGEALLIDAPHSVWEMVEPALAEENCVLKALLLTHGHYDHIGDAAKIGRMGVDIYGHADDRELFETPEIMRPYAYPPDMELEAIDGIKWIGEGDVLELMGHSIEVRHVPGHCPGNVLFYFSKRGAAFVGDALFAGSIGRFDLPGGDFATLDRAIRERIFTLPRETKVYPGHGPDTTVGDEIETNPYVGL